MISAFFSYLIFFNIDVPARIDIESIKTNKEAIFSLKSGEYNFDTGYIVGEILVYGEDEFEHYEQTTETSKIYEIDDVTICAVSPVSCNKDARLSHLFEPTISTGTIIIECDEKLIEVLYYYNYTNVVDVVWFITNPEIIYRPRIDFADILESKSEG